MCWWPPQSCSSQTNFSTTGFSSTASRWCEVTLCRAKVKVFLSRSHPTTDYLRRNRDFRKIPCARCSLELVGRIGVLKWPDLCWLNDISSILQLLEVGARGAAAEYKLDLCPCSQHDQRQGLSHILVVALSPLGCRRLKIDIQIFSNKVRPAANISRIELHLHVLQVPISPLSND